VKCLVRVSQDIKFIISADLNRNILRFIIRRRVKSPVLEALSQRSQFVE
jgi:hypothetical protein